MKEVYILKVFNITSSPKLRDLVLEEAETFPGLIKGSKR